MKFRDSGGSNISKMKEGIGSVRDCSQGLFASTSCVYMHSLCSEAFGSISFNVMNRNMGSDVFRAQE